ITLDPANRYALAADLGTDELRVYAVDPSVPTMAPQTTVALTPGAGPRHIAFHPNGVWLYVINELDSTVTLCDYAADTGAVTPRQRISTLPTDFDGANTCADIHVHPSGQFVYGSNRGHDSIAVFTVDPATGALTAAGHASTQGRTPRNFTLSRDGQFLLAANQDTGNVVVFRIDAATGGLTPIHTARIPSPVCLHLLD
ncbi:MAG: lactonase family protein, partial [Caldilineaceae bacterium]|nr:lactonase family protein [Caldilineaceae bacterium]